MEEQVAKFRLTNFSVKKSLIEVNGEIKGNLNVEFNESAGINDVEHNYLHTFDVIIKDENNALNINVVAEGYFEFDSDIDEQMKENFFKVNAPAILYPYVRAYISALTSLSGYATITLPTLNIASRQNNSTE